MVRFGLVIGFPRPAHQSGELLDQRVAEHYHLIFVKLDDAKAIDMGVKFNMLVDLSDHQLVNPTRPRGTRCRSHGSRVCLWSPDISNGGAIDDHMNIVDHNGAPAVGPPALLVGADPMLSAAGDVQAVRQIVKPRRRASPGQ